MKERTLLDYWLVLYKRKWIIGLIVLSAMVTAWILSKTVAPFYEAKAVFFVPAKADAVTFLAAPGVSTSKTLLAPEPRRPPTALILGF